MLINELNTMPVNARFDAYQRELVARNINTLVKDVQDGYEMLFTTPVEAGKYLQGGLKANPAYNFGQGAGHQSRLFIALQAFVREKNINFNKASQRSAAFLILRSKKRKGIAPAPFIQNVIEKHGREITEMVNSLFINAIVNYESV